MADDKTFTEEQHLAILADRVTKETAALTEQLAAKDAVVAEAEGRVDVAESAKVAAEQAAKQAQDELEAYKAQVETERTAAERQETRVAAMKEAAAHLPEEFFTDEKRLARIVAMDDEGFGGYVDDLKASAPGTTAPGSTAPRETAMHGEDGKPVTAATAARSVLLSRFGQGQTEKGA